MNKKIISCLLIIFSLFINTSCNAKANNHKKEDDVKVKVIINNKEYNLYLENNETVNKFIKLLPQKFSMNELNGNEKYVYLDYTLPTNSYNPRHIDAGDVMLYGNDCLVIFYKSFDTTYSYTKIGHIDNLPNLDSSNILVKFELE